MTPQAKASFTQAAVTQAISTAPARSAASFAAKKPARVLYLMVLRGPGWGACSTSAACSGAAEHVAAKPAYGSVGKAGQVTRGHQMKSWSADEDDGTVNRMQLVNG